MLSVCVALARGAEHPALAALGSTFWIALGGALCWWYARGVEATRVAAEGDRAPLWPGIAPSLAGVTPAAGVAILAFSTGRTEWMVVAGLLLALAALATGIALRARARRSAAGLRAALLIVGLPASVLGLAAPVYGLVAGFSGPVLVLTIQGFAFGAIPGLWCAGAWLLGLRAGAPEPNGPELGQPAGA